MPYFMKNMKNILICFPYFPQKIGFGIPYNLHDMSKPIFLEIYIIKKIINLSSAELAQRVVKIYI